MLLGTLGSGGSILMLPILVYAAGVTPQQAVPISLVVIGVTSLVAAALHARRGNFHPRGMLLMGSTGIAGSLVGSRGTDLLPPHALMLAFAAILFAAGIMMLRLSATALRPAVCRPARCLSAGLFIGMLTGLLGVGGGFAIVPALVLLAGMEPAVAVGTSLGIITLNSAAGLLGHAASMSMAWHPTALYVLLALSGMFIGQRAANLLSTEAMPRLFGAFLIAVGAIIAVLNLR